MTREEKKKYVDAYNKLVDLAKDGYLKKEPFDQAIRDLLFEIISKFDKEINELDARKLLDMPSCYDCEYEDLTAYSLPCLYCGRIHKSRENDLYVRKEENDGNN